MILYRLTLTKTINSAFSGEGARRVGSRWTPVGYPAVFTASSIALAVLETLVHTDAAVMPAHRVIPVEVPESADVTVVDMDALPGSWRDTPPPPQLQQFGQSWLQANDTAILKVPSAIVPQESNYIINPLHTNFDKFTIGPADPFAIDTRLLGS